MLKVGQATRRFSFAAALCIGLAACASSTGPAADSATDVPAPAAGSFVWHDLITDQPERVKAFYQGLFGWEFRAARRPDGGDYTLILYQERYVGGLVELADSADADYSRWLGYLAVTDVDQAVERNAKAGGQVVVAPQQLGQIARVAAVTDPQGAVLGLLQSDMSPAAGVGYPAKGFVVFNELIAADRSTAAAFYRVLAGYQVVNQSRPAGIYTLLQKDSRDQAAIVQRPEDSVQPQWLSFFAVDDVGAATQRAVELGGRIVLPPHPELRQGQVALVADPSGALLALQELQL